MTLNNIKNINLKFLINQELIYKYLPKDEIYLISFITKESYVIIKSFCYQGYWILIKELKDEEKNEFTTNKSKNEIEKQLNLFLKNI